MNAIIQCFLTDVLIILRRESDILSPYIKEMKIHFKECHNFCIDGETQLERWRFSEDAYILNEKIRQEIGKIYSENLKESTWQSRDRLEPVKKGVMYYYGFLQNIIACDIDNTIENLSEFMFNLDLAILNKNKEKTKENYIEIRKLLENEK